MTLIERLPWYDPQAVQEREDRTEAARVKAIEGRRELERMDMKLEQLRESAVRAGVRLSR